MRSLILFFIRFNAFFLFALLETVAIYMVIQREPQKQIWLHSANVVSGTIYKYFDNVVQYTRLTKVNSRMAEEIAWYKNRDTSSYVNIQERNLILIDTVHERLFEYIPSRIINNSTNQNNNFLTLNKGSKHGIQPNSGVVSGTGVIGIVRRVSPRFSAVMSVLHRDIKISAELKNNHYFGSLVWKGRDPRIMDLDAIPQHVNVQKGDTVVTSGFSSIFPPGQIIGIVDTAWVETGENFYTIKVELSCDLGNVEYGYVVRNVLGEEQIELEESMHNE